MAAPAHAGSAGKRDFGSFHSSNVEELIRIPEVSADLDTSYYLQVVILPLTYAARRSTGHQ